MKRINVLYICIDSTLGGSTASLFNLIESVKDDVTPIVLFPEEGVGKDFFEKHGIECWVYPFINLYLYEKNRFADVWKRPWRYHSIKKIRIDHNCFKYVKSKLAGRSIEIVHTNTSPNDIGVLLAKKLHAKHVWHVRECMDARTQFVMWGGMHRLIKLVNYADARIAISLYVKEHWKMKNNDTYVLHDAITSEDDVVYVKSKKKYVLFVSWYLEEQKGTRRCVEVFGKSGLRNDGFKLVLVGNCEDDYRVSLMETAKEVCCDEDIVFIPCQKELKNLYAEASAFLMASQYEGLGRVTAEAMFYGCPVIAHASGGTLDLVKDGETGYLFNTIEEAVSLLRKVCLSDNEQLIVRAQKFAKESLTQEVYGPKIMEVYHKVLAGRGGNG